MGFETDGRTIILRELLYLHGLFYPQNLQFFLHLPKRLKKYEMIVLVSKKLCMNYSHERCIFIIMIVRSESLTTRRKKKTHKKY